MTDRAETDALKAALTAAELEDLEGRGTRTFAGAPLRWQSREGKVHACEAAETVPDVLLVWTVCGKHDVPEGANYGSRLPVTCQRCREILALPEAQRWPAQEVFGKRRSHYARSRANDNVDPEMVWWHRRPVARARPAMLRLLHPFLGNGRDR